MLMQNKPKLLRAHIREHFKGNASRFGRERGISYSALRTYLRNDCVVINNTIYRPIRKV